MGNKLSRSSNDSKFTKPTGLYPTCEWDEKTVKKLINKKKIAPRYPGREDGGPDLDECPICFLWYPGGLNRSKCCRQPICTECFLQFKKPSSHKPVQCPFCNAFNYAVKYTGSVTKEEREAIEQEEQKVIEAKIRMRQEEMLRDAERQKELAAEREKRAREGPPPAPPAPAPSPPPPRQSSRRGDERREGERSRHEERHRDRREGDRREGDRRRTPPRSPRSSDSRQQQYHHHRGDSRRDERERMRRDYDDRDDRRDAERMYRPEEREERRRRDRDRRSQEESDDRDESGLNIDIEELMVMEAIRLSLLDKSQAAQKEQNEDEEVDDDDEEEAGAPNREEYDSEDESADMAAGRRFSDDDEDWPATSWDDDQVGGMCEPGARSDTPAFDAALWRVDGEMAQDPLLSELLAYGRSWFRAGGRRSRSASAEGDEVADDRTPSARYASQPNPSLSPAAHASPVAFEPSSTLSPKSPPAMETASTLSPMVAPSPAAHGPSPQLAGEAMQERGCSEDGVARGSAEERAEEEEAEAVGEADAAAEEGREEGAIVQLEQPIQRAPVVGVHVPSGENGDAHQSEDVQLEGAGEERTSSGQEQRHSRGSSVAEQRQSGGSSVWGVLERQSVGSSVQDRHSMGEEAIQRLEPEGGGSMLDDLQAAPAADGGEGEGEGEGEASPERRAWEQDLPAEEETMNSTIESAVGQLGADEEAQEDGFEPTIQSVESPRGKLEADGRLESAGNVLQDVDLTEFGTPPPARGVEHEGNGDAEPLNRAAAKIQTFWRGRAGSAAQAGEEVKGSLGQPQAVEEGVGSSG